MAGARLWLWLIVSDVPSYSLGDRIQTPFIVRYETKIINVLNVGHLKFMLIEFKLKDNSKMIVLNI